MSTFVLVPGFWLGGWAWKEVATELRAQGHVVYPVTLTGLGERSHLGGPHVNLDTQIADVVNLFHYEDLHDVMLVGHSFAANVVVSASNQLYDRIARMIYMDTWPFPAGIAHSNMMSPEEFHKTEDLVATVGDGWRFPLPPWEELDVRRDLVGLGEKERAHMRAFATGQPWGPVTQPIPPAHPATAALPKTAIWCSLTTAEVDYLIDRFPRFASTLTEPGWQAIEFPTGHWPMFSRPKELAELLGKAEEWGN